MCAEKGRPGSPVAQRAIAACWRYPAPEPCRYYALAADERFGVRGGLLPEERRKLRPAVAA